MARPAPEPFNDNSKTKLIGPFLRDLRLWRGMFFPFMQLLTGLTSQRVPKEFRPDLLQLSFPQTKTDLHRESQEDDEDDDAQDSEEEDEDEDRDPRDVQQKPFINCAEVKGLSRSYRKRLYVLQMKEFVDMEMQKTIK